MYWPRCWRVWTWNDREIVSVYSGADVTQAEANQIASQIESLYPDIEVELLPGDQAHYFYIIGAE